MFVDEQKVLEQIEGSPRGIASVYVRLDKNWGLKLFWYEEDRDYAFDLQSQAADHGLGPKVGEIVNLTVDCERPYGYITENVKVLSQSEINAYAVSKNRNFLRERKELYGDLMNFLGLSFNDLHIRNVGWKNGRYVCIDFGKEGIELPYDENFYDDEVLGSD
jgi:hypothetical protein